MMTQDLYIEAKRLENKLRGAALEQRLALRPSVSRVIGHMRAKGLHVPAHLRHLDESLAEDALEAQFDNIPI